MQALGHRHILGIVVGIVLLSVLAVFICPYLTGPLIHLRAKRVANHVLAQFAVLAVAAIAFQSVTPPHSATAVVEPFLSAAPILPLICVRIC
jgi:hypothetical protein